MQSLKPKSLKGRRSLPIKMAIPPHPAPLSFGDESRSLAACAQSALPID
jgi:hypothetical protein